MTTRSYPRPQFRGNPTPPRPSDYGAWYLVIVGGLAVAATLVASRGLWGLVSDRFGWSLLPVGYQVRTGAAKRSE